jgi:hypothetical protein
MPRMAKKINVRTLVKLRRLSETECEYENARPFSRLREKVPFALAKGG